MAFETYKVEVEGRDAVSVGVGSYDLWKFEQEYDRSSNDSLDDMYRLIHIALRRKNVPDVPAEFDGFMTLEPEFAVDKSGKAESSMSEASTGL